MAEFDTKIGDDLMDVWKNPMEKKIKKEQKKMLKDIKLPMMLPKVCEDEKEPESGCISLGKQMKKVDIKF